MKQVSGSLDCYCGKTAEMTIRIQPAGCSENSIADWAGSDADAQLKAKLEDKCRALCGLPDGDQCKPRVISKFESLLCGQDPPWLANPDIDGIEYRNQRVSSGGCSGGQVATIITAGAEGGSVSEQTPGQADPTLLIASGTRTFNNSEGNDGHQIAVIQEPKYGVFGIDSFTDTLAGLNGSFTWVYQLNNSSELVQNLAPGQIETDTIRYTITDSDGKTQVDSIYISVQGINNAIVFTSQRQSGQVIEDVRTVVAGAVTFNDLDINQTHQASYTGNIQYGTFSLGAIRGTRDGRGGLIPWSYTVNNNVPDVQQLSVGDTLTEQVNIAVTDGSITSYQVVDIVIAGTNDDVTITSADLSGSVTESATLTTSGDIYFSDVDLNDRPVGSWVPKSVTSDDVDVYAGARKAIVDGFSLTASATNANTGRLTWYFSTTNAAIGYLAAGETITAIFTVVIEDGKGSVEARDVTITINGAGTSLPSSDSVITGDEQAIASPGATATGNLSITNASLPPESQPTFNVLSGASTTYGSFSISSAGSWSYTPDTTNSTVIQMNTGDSLYEGITITASDGSEHTIWCRVLGADDPGDPIQGNTSGDVTEDAAQSTASGELTISDPDDVVAFLDVEPDNNGTYGSWGMNNGTWTFYLDNSNSAVQALSDGQQLVESHTFYATDGRAQTATVTINGADDASETTGDFYKIAYSYPIPQSASGNLNVTNVDADKSPYFTPGSYVGAYGIWTWINSGNGTWSYSVDHTNTDVIALGYGNSLIDKHTYIASDGTTQEVTVRIVGNNTDRERRYNVTYDLVDYRGVDVGRCSKCECSTDDECGPGYICSRSDQMGPLCTCIEDTRRGMCPAGTIEVELFYWVKDEYGPSVAILSAEEPFTMLGATSYVSEYGYYTGIFGRSYDIVRFEGGDGFRPCPAGSGSVHAFASYNGWSMPVRPFLEYRRRGTTIDNGLVVQLTGSRPRTNYFQDYSVDEGFFAETASVPHTTYIHAVYEFNYTESGGHKCFTRGGFSKAGSAGLFCMPAVQYYGEYPDWGVYPATPDPQPVEAAWFLTNWFAENTESQVKQFPSVESGLERPCDSGPGSRTGFLPKIKPPAPANVCHGSTKTYGPEFMNLPLIETPRAYPDGERTSPIYGGDYSYLLLNP